MSQKLITERAIQGKYYALLENPVTPMVSALTMMIPSNQDIERHAWLGMVPGFREWIGGRQAQKLRASEFSIANKDFESTMAYHYRERTEDKTGQLDIRLNEHALRALGHDEALLSQQVIDAESTACYDGQYFFDTDHSEGASGTQSNDITSAASSTTAPTTAEMEKAILAAIAKIISFKDDQGEPMNQNAKKFLVMVPAAMWGAARAAVGAQTITDGSGSRTGLISGWGDIQVEVVMNPRLTWTTKIAVFRIDGSVKPFIQQVREPVTVDVLGEGSDYYFDTGEVKVSLKKAGNVGLGMWQMACLVTFT